LDVAPEEALATPPQALKQIADPIAAAIVDHER